MAVGALDVRVKRSLHGLDSKHSSGGIRGNISELSDASRRRLISKARNIPGLRSLITFTYPDAKYSDDLNPFMTSGRHVKGHLERLRKAMIYRGLAGFWFLEFQRRGAPHFHVFCVGTLSQEARDSLRATWAKIVGSGCPHHLRRGMDYQELRKPEAAAGYAAKYSSKGEQKEVPEHYRGIGRFWGVFGSFPPPTVLRVSMRDLYELVRVARKAAEVQRRERGAGFRPPKDQGRVGFASWYVAPAIRYFLERTYTNRENPAELLVVAYRSRTPEC
jgi:hypothetical protein